MSDTIVALATPNGRSGIGVVRVSGGRALEIALAMNSGETLTPRKAALCDLYDPQTHEKIDEAILTFYISPHSFTGEDVIEIACHGSPVVLRQVIDAVLHYGARLADAGEFSLRAVANGKIDLSEAEAIRDLIDAQTTASARQALRQLGGEMSRTLQPVKDELLDVIVLLESALEFVEDDLPETASANVQERLQKVAAELERFAETFNAGRIIRDGVRVAIAGRPNVGKSSLFNALLGSDRAIVTDIEGTTRDHLHERILIGDIPVSLVDTAGLRQTEDLVESIGVERSRAVMTDADLIIALIDGSEMLRDEDRDVLESISELPHIIAVNKIDKELHLTTLGELGPHHIEISAKTGEGLDQLKEKIIAPFAPGDAEMSGLIVTDARHHDLLERSAADVRSSLDLFEKNTSEEIVLVGLHSAMLRLGEITGETTTEDMLTRIFSTFCIGK